MRQTPIAGARRRGLAAPWLKRARSPGSSWTATRCCAILRASGGGTVRARVVARLIEVARLIPLMERWIWEIRPGDPFCLHAAMPDEARGEGLIEAARGSLGHWLEIRKGRIFNYQIVAPTTWNFSPRDGAGKPGACEQALVGAAVREGETAPVAVQHIVRSFDPCMVCTVH